MRKRKPKMLNHRIGKVRKLQSVFTHQGVLQGRKKLHCGTPFLMARNLSYLEFCGGYTLKDL